MARIDRIEEPTYVNGDPYSKALAELQSALEAYDQSKKNGDPISIRTQELQLFVSLRRMREVSTDTATEGKWYERERVVGDGDRATREGTIELIKLEFNEYAERRRMVVGDGDRAAQEDTIGEQINSEPNADVESQWQDALKDLERRIERYKAKPKGQEKEEEGGLVVVAVRHVANSHPNSQVKRQWSARADAFERGDDATKGHILEDVGKGLAILLVTPFALAGAVIFAAGAIIYGAGTLVKGLGNALTGGLFQRSWKTDGTWRGRRGV